MPTHVSLSDSAIAVLVKYRGKVETIERIRKSPKRQKGRPKKGEGVVYEERKGTKEMSWSETIEWMGDMLRTLGVESYDKRGTITGRSSY